MATFRCEKCAAFRDDSELSSKQGLICTPCSEAMDECLFCGADLTETSDWGRFGKFDEIFGPCFLCRACHLEEQKTSEQLNQKIRSWALSLEAAIKSAFRQNRH